MNKFSKLLRKDVQMRTSHLWMVGLGIVIALGFLVNCGIAPFMPECNPIDQWELILAAGVVSGLGAFRQWALMRFKYFDDFSIATKSGESKDFENTKDGEKVLRDRLWVPFIGWFLVVGYVVNMLIVPFFHDVRPVSWSFLQASISLFLLISGGREYLIYSHHSGSKEVETENNPD